MVTFATERTTRQRDDPEGDRTVSSGLPQGLPLSPITFLLYVEPILKLTVDIRYNYGYVDDVGFLRQGDTLESCRDQLQKVLDKLLTWGRENQVDFDSTKTDIVYFALLGDTTRESLSLIQGGLKVTLAPSILWLGLTLDSRLSFRKYVDKRVYAASKIAGFIRRINGYANGLPPKAGIMATRVVVVLQMLYTSEVWWNGTER